ncbi:helix-turn-helix transcriptional regulator [Natronosalvus halobius]|uniref:helix-turn-helix transcriptional regulator n=1 Tax=Natronosalvus halobius TaxID=2953746 RepID=UPI0020A20ABD|nr:helix-turn-helix domain-containing protein [Natronosalvus halobius]USZ70555.1 helix-turn-helix domain-containing protein [Natronosalvus halobius]
MTDRERTDPEPRRNRDFVQEVMTRSELLERLADQPRTARELADQLEMARSTVHRAADALEAHGLVEKPADRFESTGLGDVVAGELRTLRTNLEAARRIEPFLNTIDDSAPELPIEHFTDATVTCSGHRQAHVGVKRITDLIEATDSLRMFSSIISPLYVDVARREILDGTEIEVIFDQRIIDIILEQHVEEAMEAFETGRFEVYVAENVPFELFLFDERVGLAAHDESGIARAFVETTDPGARSWAESLYAEYAADTDAFRME